MGSAGARGTRVLSRSVVESLVGMRDAIAAVEAAFGRHAEGATLGPALAAVPADGGGFHIKAAGLTGPRPYFAAKTNANFPDNPRHGRPTIQGTIALADAATGAPLAIVDSGSVTALRTAAASAVAARHLARRDARTLTLVGCGVQGRLHLPALAAVLPLEQVWLADRDRARAEAVAAGAGGALKAEVIALEDLPAFARRSDVCVTCTPARGPLLGAGDVGPGAFVAAVGADAPGKQELDPRLLVSARLVCDITQQCAEIGELQHAVAAGLMTAADVHAELADVVAGRRPGRTREDEITIFDSTGTALEDVALAALVYERACAAGAGVEVRLDG